MFWVDATRLSAGGQIVRYLVACGIVVVGALCACADTSDLVKKLSSKDNEVRRAAARELSELGKDAKDAVKPLAKALKDKDRFVRRFAAQALGSIGPDAAKVSIPGLTALLDDDNAAVREAGIKALAKMGPAAVPALTKALSAPSDVHEAAVNGLGAAGPTAIPALAGVIKNPKIAANLRSRAIEALPADKEARPALPALVEAVGKPAPGGQDGQAFRRAAIAAVGRLATPSDTTAVAALEKIANDDNRNNRQYQKPAKTALASVQARK
jgi:HEAT repeat protein